VAMTSLRRERKEGMKRTLAACLTGFFLFWGAPGETGAEADKKIIQSKAPAGAVEADSNSYVIGPEDLLHIQVWKEETLTRSVPVRMDGKISLPLVDEVQAAGLTPLQLKEVLVKRYKEFVDLPTINVIVMEANSFKVYLSGQVKNPGVMKLRSETSVLQLISMAGGFTDWADQKKILVIRKENGQEKRVKVNYKNIVKGTDPNFVLKAGDIVVVP
jgi:polysaccharide export outer membrane protein